MRGSTSSEAYGDFAWVYDDPLGKPFARASEPVLRRVITEYVTELNGPALDLACGTGLSTAFLRSLGFDPVGIDASVPMLTMSREREMRVAAGDLRRLPVRGKYPLVSCLYDSLNHILEPADLTGTMGEVARILDDDGIFLFDMNQPGVYGALWDSSELFTHSGRRRSMEIQTSYDESTGIATAIIRGSFRTRLGRFDFEETRRQRAWSFEEIAHAAMTAGLKIDMRLDYDPFEQARESGIGVKWLIVAVH